MRRLAMIYPLVLIACSGSGPIQAPHAERIVGDASGWTPPVHVCPEGTAETEISEDGMVTQSCMVSGKRSGPYVKWHPNGQKATQGQFVQDKRHGEWVWWHPNQRLAARGNYHRDEIIGRWTWWHPNGQMEVSGDHIAGMRAGTWTSTYATGEKRSEGAYRNGQKDGTWHYWLEDQTPERDEIWNLGTLDKERKFAGARRLEREAREAAKAEAAEQRAVQAAFEEAQRKAAADAERDAAEAARNNGP